MITIIRNKSKCRQYQSSSEYSLYINETLKLDFEHLREPEDLSQLLRDAADAVDAQNGVSVPKTTTKTPPKRKLSMMERMNNIQSHMEKQDMEY